LKSTLSESTLPTKYTPENKRYCICRTKNIILYYFLNKLWNKNFIIKRGFCKRICILTVCGLLYLSLWTSAIYFNANITTTYGEKVPLRDAVHIFFTSREWEDTKRPTKWQNKLHVHVNCFQNPSSAVAYLYMNQTAPT
jgi:hypothetical protein